jgi:hypothetical protein
VFFTGDRPHWILGTDRGGVRVFPSGDRVVHAFTSCSVWSPGEFLMYTEEVSVPRAFRIFFFLTLRATHCFRDRF